MSALRIGDAERDRAAADLGEHYALGRLRQDEHAERLDAVWTARTVADLEPLFSDLPPLRPVERAGGGRPERGGWHAVPFVPIVVALVLLTVLTHLPFVLLGLLVGAFLFWRRRHSRPSLVGGTPVHYRRVC